MPNVASRLLLQRALRSWRILCVGLVFSAGGCAFSNPQPEFALPMADKSADDLRSSLFPSDQAVMSSESLEKVLDSRIVLPAHARIAVVRVGARRWGWWTEDLVQQDEAQVDEFLNALRASPHVARATIVPSVLTPPRITVPLLREMAARTQSDLVLLYQATSYSYRRSRTWSPDETRAHCVVEALLLDTRSGVLAFTCVKTQTFSAKKTHEEIDFAETVQKAEMTATSEALGRIAQEVVEFLGRADKDARPGTQ